MNLTLALTQELYLLHQEKERRNTVRTEDQPNMAQDLSDLRSIAQ